MIARDQSPRATGKMERLAFVVHYQQQNARLLVTVTLCLFYVLSVFLRTSEGGGGQEKRRP